jgi:aldehyde:ferredoxin oxidoreductase
MSLFVGNILKVDLSARTATTEPLNKEWGRDYLGGWGLALRYFWDAVTPEVDPFSPENAIVIMSGPLGGTLAPLAGRFCAVSKSPHSGTVFESNAGGSFGPEMKFAGYDGIVIKGKAESPLYLRIKDDEITFEDASSLTGKGIHESEQMMIAAIGDPEAKVLTIGPAGENLVSFSCVGSDANRNLGRDGMGALFGSKNLKGIVCRGSQAVKVANMTHFIERVNDIKTNDLLTDDNLWARATGTPMLVDFTSELGIHMTRNWTYGVNEERKGINSDAIQAAKIASRSCHACVMACGNYTEINGIRTEGPEYETLGLAGSNCEMNSLEYVMHFNKLCNDLGMDTISTGSIVGLAMDMTEKGIKDFGLRFGEPEGYLAVVSEIANLSTDRGKDLALGAKKLAEKYNATHLSTEIKGLEMPAYDPRGNYGMGLAYATCERGACHMRAWTVASDNVFDLEIMSKEVITQQNLRTAKYSMSFCDFWGTVSYEIMADLLSVGMGEKISAEDVRTAGERIWNLTRLFNVRAGFTKADDRLPEKITNSPLEKGPHTGKVFAKEEFNKMLQIYYDLRSWDENGVPSQEKLTHLGLNNL